MNKFHTLTHKNSLLHLAPQFGCNPFKLTLNGQSVLDGNEDIEKLKADFLCKGDFLAPFPNRVCDGKYTFEGKKYQLVKNETGRGHALHGFIMKKKFDLDSTEETQEYTSASFLTRIEKDEFEGYSFEIEVRITFILKENDLEIIMSGKNIGTENAPFGVGWHPYLTVDKKIDGCTLQIPANRIMETDTEKELIPTGRLLENDFGPESRKIGDAQLDTCFCELNENIAKFENIELWMDESMNFFQSYTSDDRMSIAIEPMSCAPDAFNNELGLTTLKPNEEISFHFGVRLTR